MKNEELFKNGKRLDGRLPDELRNVRMQVGILENAQGSAYLEWGGNKIICGVYGPRECIPRHEANPYKAIIKCKYAMAPFSGKEDHGRAGPNRRSIEISMVIRKVFENLIMVEKFPRTQIEIYMDVLQSEGGTRVASLTAACLAVIDAGIPMKELVSGVSAGKVAGKVVLDLGKDEDNYGEADMPISFSSNSGDILLLQMDGLMTIEEVKEGVDLAYKGCKKLNAMQRDCLKNKYLGEEEGLRI